jgi:hypothetical protein
MDFGGASHSMTNELVKSSANYVQTVFVKTKDISTLVKLGRIMLTLNRHIVISIQLRNLDENIMQRILE